MSAGASAKEGPPTAWRRIGRTRHRAAQPCPSAVDRRTFALTLIAGAALAGWLTSLLPTLALVGATLLPGPPSVPAVLVFDGLTVVIDPGHGGFDPGVLLNPGQDDEIREADLNLAICLVLRDILVKAGARVVLTRTEDVDLVRPGDESLYGSVIRADLSRRAEVALVCDPDVFISVHCNAFPASQYRGSQCFYLAGDPASRRLAEAIQGELIRVTGETDRMANRREGLFLLQQVNVPATTVELGFLSNPRDLRLLTDPDYRRLCALAVFFGLCRFTRPPGVDGVDPSGSAGGLGS